MYDELVRRLHRQAAYLPEKFSKNAELLDVLMKAADAIELLQKTQQLSSWVPVTERLPEEYKDVLCYYEYFRYGDFNCMFRTIDRGYYGDGRWGGEAGQGHRNKVLAWMPLPQPPEEV